VAGALSRFAKGTRQYLLVTTVFGFIVAVLDTIALAIMGVPLALTWGLLAFMTNYIPNIGFIIGLVPPALLALLSGGPDLMLVVIVYGTLNFVLQSLVQPRFIGDAVDFVDDHGVPVAGFWGVAARTARRDPRDPVDVAGQGAAGGHRSESPMDRRAAPVVPETTRRDRAHGAGREAQGTAPVASRSPQTRRASRDLTPPTRAGPLCAGATFIKCG
jgi:AI-2E family transporter